MAELAASISDGIKGIATTITTALATVNWENVGQSIADFITGIDWAGVVWSLAKMVAALVKQLEKQLQQKRKKSYFWCDHGCYKCIHHTFRMEKDAVKNIGITDCFVRNWRLCAKGGCAWSKLDCLKKEFSIVKISK